MTTNVLNLPGNYLVLSKNGSISLQAANSAGSATVNGQYILLDATNVEVTGNLVVDKNGIIVKDVTLGGNEGEASGSSDSSINPVGKFIGKLIPKQSAQYDIGSDSLTWKQLNVEEVITYSTKNTGNPFNRPYNPDDMYDTAEHRKEASVYVNGGMGIEQDLNVGGHIYGRVEFANTTTFVDVTGTNVDATFYIPFVYAPGPGDSPLFADTIGEDGGLTYNPATGKVIADQIEIAKSDAAIAMDDAPLTVLGGAGISKNLIVGETIESGNIFPHEDAEIADSVYSIGDTSTQWAEAYVHNVYTRVIASTTGTIEVRPQAGVTDVFGDIRVRGTNPIGTAPVVTNILHVTMDGDDTNDGRAQDPSRACRTIGGAINSPYYQSGTQIRVAPGHYLEDNPLQLKPYTSIMGADIRTTSIEPINKTQDLFHLTSGCYLAFMQFLNGRSGLLEGPYAAGFNRGAYCTAFPPLEGDDRIDLFHSPYVQNCTNLSGPWLKDGTMFVPNQTVQIPQAVGTGTWVANTTSIIVHASTGTIVQGHAINAGQQNLGFFNARTLLLANKPFLQEQVVKHVDNIKPIGFEYSREKCFRDVGILVENVAYDAAFGGNQKAVESGLAYYDGVVSLIAGQESITSSAIDYLNVLAQQVVTNTTATDLFFDGTISTAENLQVRNTVLLGGEISTSSIALLFSTITNIINNGPSVAPAVYKSTGPDAAFVSAEILMQANRSFMQEDTLNYVNRYLAGKSFPYNSIKCRRDTGIIVDAIAQDLLYPTTGMSQSTFSGLQYWRQDDYVGNIQSELIPTVNAIKYLKDLAVKIIQNITPSDDLVDRYFTPTGSIYQNTSLEAAGLAEAAIITKDFDIVVEIVNGKRTGWTDKIIPNGAASNLPGVLNAYELLLANKTYLEEEIIAYIANAYPSLSYDQTKCRRDVGYMIDSIAFDLKHGGNRQAIQSGLYYYGFVGSNSTIHGQESQTIAAFNRISDIIGDILINMPVVASTGTTAVQRLNYPAASAAEVAEVRRAISTITNIISSGPSVAAAPSPISLTASAVSNVIKAYDILHANREFIQDDVINFLDWTYNPNSFKYNEEKCYRDVGLIVDAVSQDILLGGNQKSIEAGVSYWNGGYNHVATQLSTTTNAIVHIKNLALQIIANQSVTPQPETVTTQVINPFFQYGGDYMPQEAVKRNFGIITDIITRGVEYAPPTYAGGGLFALTGINGADVKISPTVTSVVEIAPNTYQVGLSAPTIGFGNNSTLYFGDTAVFPKQDAEVEELSLEYSYNASTWNQRKVDPIGGMGGSLVDGSVISARSPIQSFVYDAFTQLTQGGRGIHITNDGYAQLVSVFTIFASTGVQVDNGGIASIVNSNANFGDLCLVAKGYGARQFSGTVWNPYSSAYPYTPGEEGFNQYYPFGFWPNNASVMVFLPDLDDRPHISLVMEVVPPVTVTDLEGNTSVYTNEQGFPGFLNAAPDIGILTTGSIVITNIDTTGIAIGNTVYIRDQDNRYGPDELDSNGNPILYAAEGTTVVDIGYQSITLNKALTSGGSDPTNTDLSFNDKYFTLFFCGNSYYTVLSSESATEASIGKVAGRNILSTDALGGAPSQISAHIQSLQHLNTVINQIINNEEVTITPGNTLVQAPINNEIAGGAAASSFIDLRFDEIIRIINASTLAVAEQIIKPSQRTKAGPVVQGASSAITLIKANIKFLAEEVNAFVKQSNVGLNFREDKCKRDTEIILQRLIYDIETGGRYNSAMVGLSYWQREGTHHIINIGENTTRTELFPDGATVNFYQRSYISASGYVFEYVGAGTNYGALPQRGIKDPVQSKEVVQLGYGKVFFTSTDQNGDFRIGPGLVISQATGVLSGRTFTKSLFANMTPFILAIESNG